VAINPSWLPTEGVLRDRRPPTTGRITEPTSLIVRLGGFSDVPEVVA
jgi:hypothetical protein